MFLRALAAFILTVSFAFAEDTLDDMVKKTDMSSADAVFSLGQWCNEHSLPTKARQYYNQAIKLDKNHEGARAALGQVRVGERWVAQSQLTPPAGGKKPEGAAAGGVGAAGGSSHAGPSAAQITWELKVPRDPQPDNVFITQYIEKLPSLKNESTEMDSAVMTMVRDDNVATAIPRLCAALARPEFNDVYGAASVAAQLIKDGKIETARPLLPFLAKASEHVSDPQDLDMCAFALGAFKDRRAVPRLIELLDNKDAHDTAEVALGSITALPLPIPKGKAQEWWDRNHDADPKAVYLEQLKSSDPNAQADAASALLTLREKAMFPTVIKLLRSDDRQVNGKALRIVVKMTGLDFQYLEAKTKEDKEKRVQMIEKWWKDNGPHFQFPETAKDPEPVAQANAPAVDEALAWIDDLSSIAGNKAQQAEANLQSKGLGAVPALIGGLESSAPVVRRKCNDLLKTITKQDFQFDPRAEDADRAKAVGAWRTWAKDKNVMTDSGEVPEPADAPKK